MKLKIFFLIAIFSFLANICQAIRIEKEWIIFSNKTDNVSVATNSWTNGWLHVRDMAVGNAGTHGKQAINWDSFTNHLSGNYYRLTGDTLQGDMNAGSNTIAYLKSILFAMTNTVTFSPTEGEIYYSTNDYVPSFQTKFSGVRLQIGAELYIFAINNTGATITNGQPVLINGGLNGDLTVGLAEYTRGEGNSCDGVATMNIPDGTLGVITRFGIVRDLNTISYSLGDKLYANGGQLTTATNALYVAVVKKVGVTDGEIFVNPEVVDYDLYWSSLYSGITTSPDYTFNTNGGVLSLSGGIINLYSTSNFIGKAFPYNLPSTNITLGLSNAYYAVTARLTNNVAQYLVYTNTLPITTINLSSEVPVGQVYWQWLDGINMAHYLGFGKIGAGVATKYHLRTVTTDRFKRLNGSVLTCTSLDFSMDAGITFNGPEIINVPAFNTTTKNFEFWYHDGGQWTALSSNKLNNLQYDNGTSLQTLNNSRYSVNWIYQGLDTSNTVFVILGVGDYQEAEAIASQPPTPPTLIVNQAMLIGRVIFKKSATTPSYSQSSFFQTFVGYSATPHNGLTGLQGGTTDEYYHLTTNDYTNVTNLNNSFQGISNNFLKVNSATNQSISNSITIGGGLTVTGGTVSNSNGQLIMEQTGDTFGPSRLILQNRGGVNGAMFDTTGSSVDLVDFVFNPPSGIKANIRYERRPGYVSNPNGEFQLIDSDGVFNLAVGKYTNYFRGYLGVGTTVPSCALDVFGSTVLGYNNTATGLYAHAEGRTSHARGAYSHAEGLSSEAVGDVSHAEGEGSIAAATDSHAEGYFGYASGAASHSEGDSTWAAGAASHAEAFGTIAAGLGTHAEGGYTIATGRFAHAEGWATHAVGDNSHSEGSNTWANGLQTHSAGANMWVDGTNSFGWSDGTPYTNSTSSNVTFVARNGLNVVGGKIYNTNIADSANEVVNYQTMTNKVAQDVGALWEQSTNTFVSTNDGRAIYLGHLSANGVGVTNAPVNSGFNPYTYNTDTWMVFSNASRTFTISPVGTLFRFTINNNNSARWITYTNAQQVSITDTEGIWYFYFEKINGTLVASQNSWDITGEAQVSTVYWDAVNDSVLWLAEERHSYDITDAEHRLSHFDPTESSKWMGGGGLIFNTLTGNPAGSVSNTTVAIQPYTIADEDVWTYSGTNGVRQNLGNQSNVLSIADGGWFPVLYATGAISEVNWRTNVFQDSFPFLTNTVGTIGRPQYNWLNGTVWTTNNVPEDNFFVYFICGINTATNQMTYSVPHSAVYTTLTNAQTQATPDKMLLNRTRNFPANEIIVMYRLIYQASYATPDYGVAIRHSVLRNVTDYRVGTLNPILGASVSAPVHGSLAGLENDDHGQYMLTDGSRLPTGSQNYNGQSISNIGSLTVTGAINQVMVSNTIQMAFSASMTNNSITPIRGNSVEIARGRLYISNTNGLGSPAAFSQTAELTIGNNGFMSSGRALDQFDMGMVCVLLTNTVAAGDTNIFVQDATSFDINCLLYLMGSNEFVRVSSIPNSTNIILKFPTLYGHAITNGVSRVREFGNIVYYDDTSSNVLYTTTIFPADTTVNLNLDIVYR